MRFRALEMAGQQDIRQSIRDRGRLLPAIMKAALERKQVASACLEVRTLLYTSALLLQYTRLHAVAFGQSIAFKPY